jgi:transcriptional antiterminator RfaH
MTDAVLQAQWYALHVRPNYEMAVATQLRRLGVEEYLPIDSASRTAQRSKFPSGYPLFPGYIFAFLNLRAGPKLYSIPGVLRLLGYGGQATPIEDREIAMVRSITNSGLPVEAISYLQAGDRVSLTAGPLAGISGTFLHSAKDNKLVISLPLLRRSLAVTVLSEWVMAEPHGYRSAAICAR